MIKDNNKKQVIELDGMLLEEISRREFDTESDVFKISRWTKGKIGKSEWYFRRIKE